VINCKEPYNKTPLGPLDVSIQKIIPKYELKMKQENNTAGFLHHLLFTTPQFKAFTFQEIKANLRLLIYNTSIYRTIKAVAAVLF